MTAWLCTGHSTIQRVSRLALTWGGDGKQVLFRCKALPRLVSLRHQVSILAFDDEGQDTGILEYSNTELQPASVAWGWNGRDMALTVTWLPL